VLYARHSRATIAYNNGIPKDTVRLALGNGSNTVTDTYIDIDLKLVDEANRKIIDLVI
jgi:integrase